MKGLVVYDTYYGNTKAVAEAIAEELHAEGHEAELRNVRERDAARSPADVVFVGSPVRMGSVTGRAKRFVKRMDASVFGDVPLVVFTTILALPPDAGEERKQSQEVHDRGAGRKLRDAARSRGLNAAEEILWVEVEGMKGPLVPAGVEQARRFTRDLLSRTTAPSHA